MPDQRPELFESETLPCGCLLGSAIVNGEPTFVYEPCSLTCEYYLYMQQESARMGKPVEVRVVAD